MARLERGDDPIEDGSGMARVEAAQHVVCAEFQNDPVGSVLNAPLEPRPSVSGGIAGNPGIDHAHVIAVAPQGLLQHDREGGRLRQIIAGGEAVAEGDEFERSRGDMFSKPEKRRNRKRKCDTALDRTVCRAPHPGLGEAAIAPVPPTAEHGRDHG